LTRLHPAFTVTDNCEPNREAGNRNRVPRLTRQAFDFYAPSKLQNCASAIIGIPSACAPKALNDSEISRLIAAAYQVDEDLRRGPSHHPTAFAIVAMARLGLRASEALGLNWQDFDLKARRVTIAHDRT